MFEKDAEENSKKAFCIAHTHEDELIYRNGFQQGAEFGYNKANEWHYMKDGDLPKVNELVLIKITGCFVLGWTNGTNWFNDSNNGSIIDRRMVYAWKEIVLPELPKEIKEND